MRDGLDFPFSQASVLIDEAADGYSLRVVNRPALEGLEKEFADVANASSAGFALAFTHGLALHFTASAIAAEVRRQEAAHASD
jgi:hypothetical protein